MVILLILMDLCVAFAVAFLRNKLMFPSPFREGCKDIARYG
jgi:hypothetical protein